MVRHNRLLILTLICFMFKELTLGTVNDMEIEVEEEVDTGEYKSGAG